MTDQQPKSVDYGLLFRYVPLVAKEWPDIQAALRLAGPVIDAYQKASPQLVPVIAAFQQAAPELIPVIKRIIAAIEEYQP